MTRWIEMAVFVALAMVIHIAFFVTGPASGSQSQGAGGDQLISLQGASAQMVAMVEEWETPPTPQQVIEPSLTPPPPAPPSLPSLSAPQAPTAPRALPQMIAQAPPDTQTAAIDTQPATPPQRYAPTTSDRPRARPPEPAPQPQAAHASEGRAEQRASGSGGGSQAGQTQTATAAALSQGQAAELQAVWGAQIRRRIESRKRVPRNTRRPGEVRVSLTVGRNGQLINSAIRQSSGVPAYDQAALNAVARAAPFPAAPSGLTQGSYRFGLIVGFTR